jgi:DNA gyrase subunit B
VTRTDAPSEYSAKSLTVLKGLEAVRKRPGMYVGDNGSRGLTHLVYEIIDNAVDEALAGHCADINVILHADGSVSVADNGRGIPVDIEPESGMPGAILVLVELHAGGKFGGGGYDVAGGLHGVGASVVNALSTRVELEVDRDGRTHLASFHNGEPGVYGRGGAFTASPAMRLGGKVPEGTTGTRIRFWPDRDLFLPGAEVDTAAIVTRVRQTAFLVPGLRLRYRDETPTTRPAGTDAGHGGTEHTSDETEKATADSATTGSSGAAAESAAAVRGEVIETLFVFDGGVADFATYRAADRPLHPDAHVVLTGQGYFTERVPIMVDGKQVLGSVDRTLHVDIALRWGAGYDANVASFVNVVATSKGGTHATGFERSLVKVINEQLKAQKITRAKDEPVTKDDCLEGLTAVVAVKLGEPQFVSQTKDELATPAAAALVAAVVTEKLTAFLTDKTKRNPATAILEKALGAARTRLAAREVREAKRRKTALESASMPAKLVDCRSEDITRTELFIVEGDSALGTFKNGRDSEFQAALPVRGKILNVFSVAQPKMLANKECLEILQVMGAGFGKNFDTSALRYGKLIALSDADVDGAHIRCLLLTLCWKYMRPLLEDGHVYAAVPPLHRIEVVAPKKEYLYTYSDDELTALLGTLEQQGKRVKEGTGIQRYKGLGEMSADQLAETTLDPTVRRLRRLTVGDGEAAAAAFELCMGAEVAPRRDFIMDEGGLLDENLIDA